MDRWMQVYNMTFETGLGANDYVDGEADWVVLTYPPSVLTSLQHHLEPPLLQYFIVNESGGSLVSSLLRTRITVERTYTSRWTA
jgi:hypothetical protein